MKILEKANTDNDSFTLPGYSAEGGVYLGSNVVMEHGMEVKKPVLLQDNVWCSRNVRLNGLCIIGKGAFIDEGTHLQRTVVCDNTYIGEGLELVDPAETFGDVWYEYDGKAYSDRKALIGKIRVEKQKIYDEMYEDLNDLISVICPIESKDDPVWEKGARSIIMATCLAMLEDSLNPELNLTKDKFNFFNLTQIAARRDEDQNDPTATLRNYFQGRDILSECVSLANTVVVNAAVTTKGYLGHVTGSLQMFSDNGICYLTSGTDLDLANFSDKPSALFIKIPDEKDSRHALANMYISQLYNALIERANKEMSKIVNLYHFMAFKNSIIL